MTAWRGWKPDNSSYLQEKAEILKDFTNYYGRVRRAKKISYAQEFKSSWSTGFWIFCGCGFLSLWSYHLLTTTISLSQLKPWSPFHLPSSQQPPCQVCFRVIDRTTGSDAVDDVTLLGTPRPLYTGHKWTPRGPARQPHLTPSLVWSGLVATHTIMTASLGHLARCPKLLNCHMQKEC